MIIIMSNKRSNVPQAGRLGGAANGPVQRKGANPTQVGGARRRRRRRGNRGVSRVDAPVARGMRFRETAARVTGDGHVMVIKHRELVADVSGSTGFAVTGYPVNPGQGQTFPWLSVLARNFEKYRFRRLKFEFESSQPTTAQGMTMLAFDLDASDPAPTSKVQLMSYQGASRANVWEPQATSLPEQQPPLYVRVGTQPTSTDIKTYDAANLWFGTAGEASVTVIGELYVEYEVELHVPQLSTAALSLGGSLRLTGTTGSFVGSAAAGSMEYVVLAANTFAVRAVEGQSYFVHGWAICGTGQPIDITGPATFGQALVRVNVSHSPSGGVGLPATRTVDFRVTSLTDATYAEGAGWMHFRCDLSDLTGLSTFAVYVIPVETFVTTAATVAVALTSRVTELERMLRVALRRLPAALCDTEESSSEDDDDDVLSTHLEG